MTKFARRTFIQKTMSMFGASILFHDALPKGLQLLIEENPHLFQTIPGKHPEMSVLNDRPLNAETPPHLLAPQVTPADRMFVRNNGIPPKDVDVNSWKLVIEGESARQKMSFSIADLKSKFSQHTLQLTLECGGNGRSEFNPPAKGNQWTNGAVACPNWTGVRLKDVLEYVGFTDEAKYIGYYGKDVHLSGDESKLVISRGVPMNKALEDESLIAWSMNGEDLPDLHGYPLRLVFGGWPASCSGKWLHKIVIRNQVHDGPKMGGQSYRVPCDPVSPGTKVDDQDMCVIESMPVKSLITSPKSGGISTKPQIAIAGKAWAGDLKVNQVQYSIDFGQTWNTCSLRPAANRLAWQEWNATVTLPEKGYFEIWAKATDENGRSQPMVLPGWNPKGYLNNACHRIAVKYV